MKTVSIGDEVEVSFPTFPSGTLHKRATVCYVDGHKAGVEFKDGTRMMLERGAKHWRLLLVNEAA